MIAILGAGLSGLSAAYHLKEQHCVVYEREAAVGGLCRSYRHGPFTFDYTGHLLHLRDASIRRFVSELLPSGLALHGRQAAIYSQGVYTPYPFQVHLYGLPQETIQECLEGFMEAMRRPTSRDNLRDWILSTFGPGIARHFLFPYNQKLWRTDLSRLSIDWVGWAVPRPSLEEVIQGAQGKAQGWYGYNATFLYPQDGGIGLLAEALADRIPEVHLGKEAVEIQARKKRLTFQDGSSGSYERLISTLPLPELLNRITDLPAAIQEAGKGLRYVSVYDVNLGVGRERISDKHWIYFPEEEFAFYRVGFPMNFSASLGPPGTSSLYAEISCLPEESFSPEEALERVVQGLERCGILQEDDVLLAQDVQRIRYAYVIHNPDRRRLLPWIQESLEEAGIHTIGRYGGWGYSSMEEALLEGRRVASTVIRQAQN
ncbi:MAG: FAD-dependent oxidoreductase [Candidatus Tectomicrobia bacterium]|uniref:FAD-dependent oxidoreductase n=1 Tax=Tectimicrobiota bacterium TaxID=2528274 RepID=A0A932CNH3_UNCTE|nr:FAD-dependent oxidoreductase [Candidatus Tectomicrobia bacterium]